MVSVALFLFFCIFFGYGNSLKIALHAQVAPVDKIVGSVITTDGLRKALQRRKDVSKVEVFYPFHYLNFTTVKWDLIIIEGWFPMINDFFFLARSEFPDVKIVYYCLDPSFPILSTTLSLDVDGYATNSIIMVKHLSEVAPTVYLPLAADAEVMTANYYSTREWDCIYIGAGGYMLKVKPLLRKMLLSCSHPQYKLRLHGSHWDQSPEEIFRKSWQGLLPKNEIATAYNSAKVVLASTIKDQAEAGMINNRIFEALACGSLVVSDWFPALDDLLGHVIYFANSSDDVQSLIQNVLSSEEKSFSRRSAARETVMASHTWDHRVIPLLEFYTSLTNLRDNFVSREPRLVIAIIVSEKVKAHGDYHSSILPSLRQYFNRGYQLQEYNITTWKWLTETRQSDILHFSVIVAIFTPYDQIHLSFFEIDPHNRKMEGRDSLQKRFCFILGSPPTLDFVLKVTPFWYHTLTDIFDLVLYRDMYEKLSLLDIERQHQFYNCSDRIRKCDNEYSVNDNLRWQHAFGVAPKMETRPTRSFPLILCVKRSMHLCTQRARSFLLSNGSYNLVLIGGNFNDWLDFCLTKHEVDCVIRSTQNFSSLVSMLSNTYHFSGYHDQILSMLCSAEKVYFFFDVQKNDDSLEDELWPLIGSTVCNRPIHFLHEPGPHLKHVLSAGCETWDAQYLQSSWKQAAERLFGLGSSRSKVAILSNYHHGAVISIDQLMQQSLVILPSLENFIPGRDGKVCIYVNNVSRLCLIREYLEFVIHLHSPIVLTRDCSLTFSLVLHSHMFADSYYTSDPLVININRNNISDGIISFNNFVANVTVNSDEIENVNLFLDEILLGACVA